jgi:hypothetical protein
VKNTGVQTPDLVGWPQDDKVEKRPKSGPGEPGSYEGKATLAGWKPALPGDAVDQADADQEGGGQGD